jgi:excisionase family DNA binding protein
MPHPTSAVAARFLVAEEVAELLRRSTRSVHELTRTGAIPHRRLAGTRRLLFVTEEIEAWINGAELERVDTADGGRVVRPKVGV